MSELRAYSGRQFVLAVCLAAVLGWAAFTVPIIFDYATRPGLSYRLANAMGYLVWAALIGLPIAFISSWAVAGPILWRVMARAVDWRRAAAWGLIVPAAMAIAGVILGRLMGLFAYLDSTRHSEFYGPPGVPIEIDGILMPYGWWLTAQSSAIFVAIGFAVAMVVRAVIGPGTEQRFGSDQESAAE